jgi:CheY-like chemotaxis protein
VLVVLDLTKPVMGGAETWRRLRKIAPDVLVIGSSGYDETKAASHFGAGVAVSSRNPTGPGS